MDKELKTFLERKLKFLNLRIKETSKSIKNYERQNQTESPIYDALIYVRAHYKGQIAMIKQVNSRWN